MAWTAPRTWVTNETVTASHMNTHVRDNFLETAPAKATTSGGFIVTTGVNSVIQRTPVPAAVATSQTTTSTSYTDLATAGPAVTEVTGTRALVCISARIENSVAGGESWMAVTVSGASAVAAADGLGLGFQSYTGGGKARIGMPIIYSGLTEGSNTFTAKYRVSTGTGTFVNRRIEVIPF